MLQLPSFLHRRRYMWNFLWSPAAATHVYNWAKEFLTFSSTMIPPHNFSNMSGEKIIWKSENLSRALLIVNK